MLSSVFMVLLLKQREEDLQLNNTDKQWGSNHRTKKEKTKRGPRAVKFARSQAKYKRRNGIIKAIHDLKVATGDDSSMSLFKHPVDGSTDERTTQKLISKLKSFSLEDFSVESTNEIVLANMSSESLAISSPSKPVNARR